ncbi:MAG: CpsD/CapB family tyrosine-protein kinase [Terracidiphilus sp.]|jgi:capsular exopolysaccharide synthesis family protein
MSHIFDALQRSEEELPGIDSPPAADATELLRRAERRKASNWETAVLFKKNIAAESAKLDPSFGSLAATPDSTAQEGPQAYKQILNDNHCDVFSQFQHLQVALAPQNRLVSFSDDENPAAEAFRLLGVRLRDLRRHRPLRKVLVTSTVPQEGKSMVSANLACTLALSKQQKVLLIEGDLRRPSLSKEFGLGRNPGLFECLKGERALTSCIYQLEGANIWILPAGSAHSNPLGLLQSGPLSRSMDQLAEWFDWIIIDSPPVLPLADTSIWARLADGIILVTRQGITKKQQLQRGLEAIESKKLIGALMNCSQNSSHYDYYYRATSTSATNGQATT